MTDTTKAWALHCVSELAQHITDAVNELLPEDLRTLAAGPHVMLEKAPAGGTPRVVREIELNVPDDFATTSVPAVAYYALKDIQDEVVLHLHEAWPTNKAGIPLHAWTAGDEATVELAFRGDGANNDTEPINLAPFTVPPNPDGVIPVG